MKKSITISIPEPCHQGWEKMSPTQKGRFCGSCEKEVIDFSKKRDEDLVKELAGASNICGRFNSKQLNREVILERKSSYGLAPYAASLLLPLTLLSNNPLNATENTEKEFVSLGIGSHSKANSVRYQVTTSGVVRDANGNPIANVEIIVKESGKSEVSGLRGDYEIKSLDNETLIFKKKGFEAVEVKLQARSGQRDIKLLMTLVEETNYEPMILGKIAPPEIVEEIATMGDIAVIEEYDEQSTVILSGTVSDPTGPLPGVNILIKGTNTGTQTDFDGHYELKTEASQVLVFNYLGYKTREITVSNISNTLDVTLEEDLEMLGEVIIMGYSVQQSDAPSTKPFSDIEFQEDPESTLWKNKLKAAQANEIEFKRIKQARKKVARMLKKSKRQ